MTIREVELPLTNLQVKLHKELKAVEKWNDNTDGCDSNFHYTDGKADGIRLALKLIEKQMKQIGVEVE
jgi:hypothetical protein